MVPSMGTMERLYSPKINNVAVVFNFNTIFYVRSRSEEISPFDGDTPYLKLIECTFLGPEGLCI